MLVIFKGKDHKFYESNSRSFYYNGSESTKKIEKKKSILRFCVSEDKSGRSVRFFGWNRSGSELIIYSHNGNLA